MGVARVLSHLTAVVVILAVAAAAPSHAQTVTRAATPDPSDPQWRGLMDAFLTRLEPYFFDEADAGHRAIPDGELLVLQVRVDRFTLDAPVTGVKQGRGVLVPVGEFARALFLAITVDPEAGRAEGWAFSEANAVTLDVASRTMTAGATRWTLQPQDITTDGLDVYIHTNALSVWLDMEIAIDFRALVVELTPRRPLPIVAQFERRRRGAPNAGGGRVEPRHPRLDTPYRWIDKPFVDAQGAYALRRGAGGDAQSSGNYSVLATGDLARTTGTTFIAGDAQDPVRNARLSLSRTSPEGALGGGLGATFVEVGDVQPVDLPFAGFGDFQRGVRVTNRPVNASTSFGSTDIEGDVPLGWDVELYRNDVRIGFQSVEADGRYTFEDVPLFAGANDFRIVLYGPRGEVREERRSVPVDPRVGERFTYDLSLTQQGRSLLGFEPAADAQEQGLRLAAAAGVRVARWLTADLGVDTPIVDGETRLQGVLGATTAAGPAVLRAVARADAEGGVATRGDITLPVLTQQVRLAHRELIDFPQAGEPDGANASTSTLAVSGPAPLPGPSISHQLAASYTRTDAGDLTAADWRVSTRLWRADLAAGVTWEELLAGEQPSRFFGNVAGALSGRRFLTRARLAFDLNTDEVSDLDLSVRYRPSRDFSVSARAQRVFAAASDTLEARADWDAGPISIGPRFVYSSEGPFSALIDARVSAVWDPAGQTPRITSDRITSFGAVAARVYEDVDGDGRFTANDRAIEGARINVVAARREALSDADGTAYVGRLAPHRPTDVELDVGSLDDPYLAPVRPGVSLAPRPGRVQTVDIPVRATSDIEGVVRLRRRAGVMPLAGAVVRALDADGREQGRTQTSSDGFYVLSGLPAGLHRIVVDPALLAANGWRPDASSFLLIRRTREILIHDLSVATADAPPMDPAPGVFAPVDPTRVRRVARDALDPEAVTVWLGRYDSAFGRDAAALMLIGRFPAVLRARAVLDAPATGGAQGHALMFGPFASTEAAERACAALASAAPACRVAIAAARAPTQEVPRLRGRRRVFE